MKYIRTEDGVYEVVDNLYENSTWYYRVGNQAIPFRKGEKQYEYADTIEELCDKFVITFNNKSLEPRQFKVLETALDYLKDCDKKYCPELKGAIWTSKGLIYVAKMNEKGELELI